MRDKKFIVITTRRNTSENQVEIIKFLNEHNLQWKSINFVKDEKEKLKLALRFNSDLHFEDSEEAINLFNQANINCINCFNLEKWNLWLERL